ncbi:MAG: SGNH/GDSL hydrolase family protein [Pseudoalteromonas prydzensis]|uniref:SGNH/GDSL hydrolase family protein n=1 Tax=Pseudoalteromonas prydzensis TaxID=182141 RepID=UPI003F9E228B
MKNSAYKFAASLLLALAAESVLASELSHNYVTSWTSSPQAVWDDDFIFPTNIPETLENQTVRQAVKVSLGGDSFRIEMSNAYGNTAIKLGKLTVGIPTDTNDIYTLKKTVTVTFGGVEEATILPGATILSDNIPLRVSPLSSIVISAFVPEKTAIQTFHWDGRQTNLILAGDQSQALQPSKERFETTARLFISGLFVRNSIGSAIAVIGDSITDGATASLNKNTRWTDFLAERLRNKNIGVFNAGISGARLLSDGMGSNALSRLHRDVISKPGVSHLIVLLGINDIAWPGTLFAPSSERPNINKLIAGFTQLAAQVHLHGKKILVATLPPFEGALPETPLDDYYNEEKNSLRLTLNNWIRNAGVFDGIIDTDKILRDPDNPNRMKKKFDSGDHLHPSDTGSKAMAYGFDITELLKQTKMNSTAKGVQE